MRDAPGGVAHHCVGLFSTPPLGCPENGCPPCNIAWDTKFVQSLSKTYHPDGIRVDRVTVGVRRRRFSVVRIGGHGNAADRERHRHPDRREPSRPSRTHDADLPDTQRPITLPGTFQHFAAPFRPERRPVHVRRGTLQAHAGLRADLVVANRPAGCQSGGMTETRRWDIDERRVGVADAAPMAGDVRRLLDAMGQSGWVTEDAYAHLGKYLRALCEQSGASFRWLSEVQGSDGVYEVELGGPDGMKSAEFLRAAIRLLSRVAEMSFHVRQRDDWTVECVTGQLDGDGDFATHGHTIRLRLQQ